MKKILLPLAAASVMFFSCNNSANDSVAKADSVNNAKADSPAIAQPSVKTDDKTAFLVKAANGGLAEVKLAQLAKQKSKDSIIINFADMMIADYGGANAKVKSLAAERNVTLPAASGADEQKMADELSKKDGKNFDGAYADAMVKGHTQTLDMFKKASVIVTDVPLTTFIDNTIPVIEHHL
jgi:putative membrane protein